MVAREGVAPYSLIVLLSNADDDDRRVSRCRREQGVGGPPLEAREHAGGEPDPRDAGHDERQEGNRDEPADE